MTKETPFPFFGSDQWASVDDTGNSGVFIAFLDKTAVTLRDTRSEIIRLLEVSPGCSVLDVGSGAGEFLIELASSVEGVRAVGIDASQEMVTTATSRAQAAGVAVQFTFGDAQQLNFPDEFFDRVNCSRVLAHVEDPRTVISGIARVLAPGGRFAIFEPDIDAYKIDSDNIDAVTAARQWLAGGIQNPNLGRRLQGLVLEGGLNLLEVSRVTHAKINILDYFDNIMRAGNVAAEMANQWRTRIETAYPSDQIFMSPVAIRALATKHPR